MALCYLLVDLCSCEFLQPPLDLWCARLSERCIFVLLLRHEAVGLPLNKNTDTPRNVPIWTQTVTVSSQRKQTSTSVHMRTHELCWHWVFYSGWAVSALPRPYRLKKRSIKNKSHFIKANLNHRFYFHGIIVSICMLYFLLAKRFISFYACSFQ